MEADVRALSDAKSAAPRWPFALVIAVALLAMGRAAANDWAHYDDDLFLFRNVHYNPPTLGSLAYDWSHSFRGLWTPVTQSVWWLIAKLAILDVAEPDGIRLNPWMFHAANVLIHCGTSALAFVLIRRAVRSTWPAIAGSIVFAAHPVQVEAVAWACGTKDLLAAFFTLATLVASTTSSRRWWYAPLAIVLACAALLSKPSAVMLPVLIAAYAWTLASSSPPGRPRFDRRVWWIVAITGLLAIPVLIIAHRVQDVADVPAMSLALRPIVALDALTMHLQHFVWPVGLCADYGLTPGRLMEAPRRWWTWCVPMVLALLAWRSRDRVLLGGTALVFLSLAPNLGISPFQFQVYSTVADRYAYLATFGVALVVARLSQMPGRADHPDRYPKLIATILGLILIPIAFLRSGDWQDAAALWTRVLSVNAGSSLANNNLGSTMLARGDVAGAMRHFEAAAADAGSADSFALLNLAQLHLRQREPAAAANAVVRLIELYRRRAEFDPDLERQTIDRFARELSRLDPAVADRMRERLAGEERKQTP